MGIVSADFGGRRIRRRIVRWVVFIFLGLALFWWAPRLLHLYTEWLWFKFDVGFPGVFWTVLNTKIGLGVVFGLAFLILVLGNVELARRLARRTVWYDEERALRQRIAEVMEYFAARYLYLALAVFAVLVAYGVGRGAADQWNKFLLFQHGVSFGTNDPIFGRDVGFYVFRLPFWQFLWQWAYVVLWAVFVLSAGAHYLDKAIRVLRGVPAFAPHVKVHLSVLLAAILVVKGIGYRLDAFNLLYSPRGVTFGASYADIHAQLLAYSILFWIALGCALLVLISVRFRGLWLPVAGIGFLLVSSLLLNLIYPALIQRIQVQPNEFEREKEYIAHSIEFTRRGFGLDRIEARKLDQLDSLTMAGVEANVPTVENVRLWDYRPLLDTYQNQQAIWNYYRFKSVDVDRYDINGRYRQVMLAPRELDMGRLAEILRQQSWQNDHIFYTHGHGVAMSPVSDVIDSGLPNYVIKDIPPASTFAKGEIRQHGIYYGELTNNYVIVGTKEEENDYTLPGTNQVAKTRYSGAGGVPIGSALPRLAAGARFKDVNIIISTIITKDSRILWNRNIALRARHIAPFLGFDQDPYIVVGEDGGLYWIQDAYTTSNMYPYSDRVRSGSDSFNYVRNSVKVVTDAYEGTVVFYVADPDDPIVQTYQKIFPAIFKPMAEMPAGLGNHLRYPEALFNTQSERLTIYHMTDPRVFYNRIEKWAVARERPKSLGQGGNVAPRGDTSEGEVMQAYYAIVRLPGESDPEYLLMLPFTPEGRPNMAAWLAARCDGENYGKLLVYNFSKTEQVWGPMQIEASIDQDPDISEKISLWNTQGSAVIRGNLLVIPLDNSILYVEPIYLRAAQSPFPELKRVIVARGDGKIAMGETLTKALAALLGGTPPKLAALEPSQMTTVPTEGGAPAPGPVEVVTPAPAPGIPADAYALAADADRYFKEALERQREGDWAGYGESLEKLQQTLSQLVEKTKP